MPIADAVLRDQRELPDLVEQQSRQRLAHRPETHGVGTGDPERRDAWIAWMHEGESDVVSSREFLGQRAEVEVRAAVAPRVYGCFIDDRAQVIDLGLAGLTWDR